MQNSKPVEEVFRESKGTERDSKQPHNRYETSQHAQKSHITYKCTFVHASDDANAATMNSYAVRRLNDPHDSHFTTEKAKEGKMQFPKAKT